MLNACHPLLHASRSSHSNSSTQSTAVDSRLVWHRRQLRACYRRNVTVVRAASHARGAELGWQAACSGLHSWKCRGAEKRRARGSSQTQFVKSDITDLRPNSVLTNRNKNNNLLSQNSASPHDGSSTRCNTTPISTLWNGKTYSWYIIKILMYNFNNFNINLI